ncbi:MAG: nitroreductase family protein [archaeon]|nr:nitroreductase family protein [archaeon]
MAPIQTLTPDELLTTTRSVRKRLDLTRDVDRRLIEECLRIAQQAPNGGNRQNWHFVVITDPAKRAAIGNLYRKGWEIYSKNPNAGPNLKYDDPKRSATRKRITSSSQYLADHMHEVPVQIIPCLGGRIEGESYVMQSASWGTIAPAAWSFMLAARARGLGTCWTSLHLFFEEEAAKILGIPYPDVRQACLIPVAYLLGTEFKKAPREPLEKMAHWEHW